MDTDKFDTVVFGSRLTAAQKVCEVAHDGQQRWDGTPYADHPKAVAAKAGQKAKDMGFDLDAQERVVIVGLLHDVIEDTELGGDFIVKRFGAAVGMSVLLLTRPPEGVFSKQLAQKLYEDQIRHGSVVEVLVKLADVWHNANTPAADARRAASWAVKSAHASLQVIRRWLEDNPAASEDDAAGCEVLSEFYTEAYEAVEALIAKSRPAS